LIWSYHKARYFLSDRDIPILKQAKAELREAAVKVTAGTESGRHHEELKLYGETEHAYFERRTKNHFPSALSPKRRRLPLLRNGLLGFGLSGLTSSSGLASSQSFANRSRGRLTNRQLGSNCSRRVTPSQMKLARHKLPQAGQA
jgi:hypothetical protein